MAHEIATAISKYQYHGLLKTATQVNERADKRDPNFRKHWRYLWYVLDDDPGDNAAGSRASRGPGDKSWIRNRSKAVVDKLMRYFSYFSHGTGLFVTPFAAQARTMNQYIRKSGYVNWSASTIHAQQGTEADWVIFDTVHASSTGWPFDEWKRLVNVGLSRSKEQVILIASRSEMSEPYLSSLAPYFEKGTIFNGKWKTSSLTITHSVSEHARQNPDSLGAQIEQRKCLMPVLSGEQERLIGLSMDGKAKLVRGVAGSGKTYVLANWLVKLLQNEDFPSNGKIWVLYANQALLDLIESSIRLAWTTMQPDVDFPDKNVEFIHLTQLVKSISKNIGYRISSNEKFEYNEIARKILKSPHFEMIEPSCDAIFIDEAQDFGHSSLELRFRLVKSYEPGSNAKPAMIFYDNAQEVYSRETPIWSHLGLDVRGRSTIMKESFRSTKQTNEFAANVLFRLSDASDSSDYRVLVSSGLLEVEEINGREHWRVNYN